MPMPSVRALLPPRYQHLSDGETRRVVLAWGGAFFGAGLLVVLALLPPFLGAGPRAVLMHGFSFVCHQIPSRSPHLDGVPLAVCHRCFGVYVGLPVAVLGMVFLYRFDDVLYRRAPWLLGLAVLPMAVDWGGDVLGFWTNTPHSRIATGLLFGMVAGYYVARGVVEVFAPSRTTEPPGREDDGAPT